MHFYWRRRHDYIELAASAGGFVEKNIIKLKTNENTFDKKIIFKMLIIYHSIADTSRIIRGDF